MTARALLTLLAPFTLTGCLGMLDVMGFYSHYDENVDQYHSYVPEDDDIADKHPQYDPALTVEEDFEDCTLTLNKSGSVTKLDILPFEGAEADLDGRMFHSRADAIDALDVLGADQLPSMEIVNGGNKPFNDGLVGAVNVDLQAGADGLAVGKRAFLQDLLSATVAMSDRASATEAAALDEAAVHIGAALLAGGNEVDLAPELASEARTWVGWFDDQPLLSTPIAFYDWSPALQEVFRQDRFLQNLLPQHEAPFDVYAALAVVLEDDADLAERYASVLALNPGLVNPYASYTPLDLLPYVDGLSSLDHLSRVQSNFEANNPEPFFCTGAEFAVLPSSVSRDTEFFNQQFCDTGLPDGVSMMDVLIAAIQAGDIDLQPDADSGWYDYQLWALETLLVPENGPESDHLLLTAAYKEKLIETFEALITETRETQVKDLQMGMMGASAAGPAVELYPWFPAEPFPTHYLRTARGYRFLQTWLRATLGDEYLASHGRVMEGGERGVVSLADELQQHIDRSYGLYALTAAHLGMDPDAYLLQDELAEVDVDAAMDEARTWLEGWQTDADVQQDPRVIVPVAYDALHDDWVYWATVGVKVWKVGAEFVEGYEPELVSGCEVRDVVPHQYFIMGEAMREVHLRGAPPTRDEFRAICDQYDDADDIVGALEER